MTERSTKKAAPPRSKDRLYASSIGQTKPKLQGRVTVAQLAAAKKLPADFLKGLGVSDIPDGVLISYLRQDRTQCSRQRLRTAISAKNGSIWLQGKGSPEPYGLWKLGKARKADQLIIVEGESDTWTLWYHDFPALGIPGASMWRTLRAEHLEGIYHIYIAQEPDEAGGRFVQGITEHIRTLNWDGSIYRFSAPNNAKDINELHLQNQESLPEIIKEALATATNLTSNAIPSTLEVRSARKINAAELKKQAENNATTLTYLPLLGMDGFFVQGWSHVLAGFPKTGKTELITAACQQWSPNKILFISEEPESIWQERLKKHDGEWQHVTIMLALGMEQDEIEAEIETCEESIVVIDTTRTLLRLQNENDNSEVANTLLPHITAARQSNKTLIFLHHTRKSGGDHGHAISGAHAFIGIVDIAL